MQCGFQWNFRWEIIRARLLTYSVNLEIHWDCRIAAVTKGSRIAGESVGDAWDTLLPPVNNWTLPPPSLLLFLFHALYSQQRFARTHTISHDPSTIPSWAFVPIYRGFYRTTKIASTVWNTHKCLKMFAWMFFFKTFFSLSEVVDLKVKSSVFKFNIIYFYQTFIYFKSNSEKEN